MNPSDPRYARVRELARENWVKTGSVGSFEAYCNHFMDAWGSAPVGKARANRSGQMISEGNTLMGAGCSVMAFVIFVPLLIAIIIGIVSMMGSVLGG